MNPVETESDRKCIAEPLPAKNQNRENGIRETDFPQQSQLYYI